jgi:GT2 family glycosyltransferase
MLTRHNPHLCLHTTCLAPLLIYLEDTVYARRAFKTSYGMGVLEWILLNYHK